MALAVALLCASRRVVAQEAGIALGAAAPGAAVESLDGKAVEWLEQVTDDQYSGR
jgi:hypothetical protein